MPWPPPPRLRAAGRAALLPPLALLSGACGHYDLASERRPELMVAPIETTLVRVSEAGIAPPRPIELEARNGGIAFASEGPGRRVAIVFPTHAVTGFTCSFTNGFTSEGGATFTPAALAPGAVASLCFHEPGTYPFTALVEGGASFTSSVIVRAAGVPAQAAAGGSSAFPTPATPGAPRSARGEATR